MRELKRRGLRIGAKLRGSSGVKYNVGGLWASWCGWLGDGARRWYRLRLALGQRTWYSVAFDL